MGIVNPTKEISKSVINCGDSFNIKLSLTGIPNIINNPTDIVLILDCSGSMTGIPIENLKSSTKKFIEIIATSTNGIINNEIGNSSRIGIVSFSDRAVKEIALTNSVNSLNQVINSLKPSGSTNHSDAFIKAMELFDTNSSNEKVIVMFTDGKTNVGISPVLITDSAKSQGVIIYCIGLEGNMGIDVSSLNDWSSLPSSSYVSITPDAKELENLFKDLAIKISNPGATNIEIKDKINTNFKINNVINLTKGNAEILESNLIRWTIDSLGETEEENATLEFSIKHIGNNSGEIKPNEKIIYRDNEGNNIIFNSPIIKVICDDSSSDEEYPKAIDITIDNCEDFIKYDVGDIYMDSLGRIIEINATIKNVCPNRRIALAALLTEVDNDNREHKRGIKTIVIPAHSKESCQDIKINCLKFVLPEELDTNNNPNSICNKRNFRVRFIMHYVDYDMTYCSNAL